MSTSSRSRPPGLRGPFWNAFVPRTGRFTFVRCFRNSSTALTLTFGVLGDLWP